MIRNNAGYFQLESFNREKGIIHGISARSTGNLSCRWGDEAEVAINRRSFFKAVGVGRGKVVTLNLQHGDNIAVIKNIADRINDLEADAVITNHKKTFLFFPLGDCYPIFYFDPIQKAIGLAHLGWRGAVANLHLRVVEKMEKEFGTRIPDLLIGLGPGICEKCNHQPRPLVQEGRAEWRPYLRDLGKSKVCVDLLGFCRDSLVATGVKRERIEISGLCTAENFLDFFSERAVETGADSEPMGRFGAIIGMK